MSISSPVERIDLVRIAAGSGRVRVIAGDHTFRVDGEAHVRVDGGEATVETSQRITVYVPTGTHIVVGTRSGEDVGPIRVKGLRNPIWLHRVTGAAMTSGAEMRPMVDDRRPM